MKTTWKTLPVVVLALLAAVPGTVQRFDGVRFTSPLTLSGGRDENFIVGDREVDDTVYLFNAPTLSVLKNTHSKEFSLNYQPEFEFILLNPGVNSWNHRANLRWRQKLTSRWSLAAGDFFLSTKDPAASWLTASTCCRVAGLSRMPPSPGRTTGETGVRRWVFDSITP